MEQQANGKAAILFAFILGIAGLVIGIVSGIGGGSWIGGCTALAGIPVSLFGLWKGIQRQTQGQLAGAVMALLFCIGIGALLIILKLIDIGRDAVS